MHYKQFLKEIRQDLIDFEELYELKINQPMLGAKATQENYLEWYNILQEFLDSRDRFVVD